MAAADSACEDCRRRLAQRLREHRLRPTSQAADCGSIAADSACEGCEGRLTNSSPTGACGQHRSIAGGLLIRRGQDKAYSLEANRLDSRLPFAFNGADGGR
jgi:hypothetical protein